MLKNLASTEEMQDFFGTRPIISSSIKLTRKCNLRCKHCYVDTDLKFKEMSISQIKSTIDFLLKIGCMNLFFNGGEPFLRNDITEIFEYAFKKGISVSISSNGMLLNEQIIKNISNFNPKLFQISIDGPKNIHNEIRRNNQSFDKAIEALKFARKYFNNNTQIVMATTISMDNKDYILNMLEIAKQLMVDTYCIVPLMPSSKKKFVSRDISVGEKDKLIKKISDVYIEQYKNFFEISIVVPPALVPKSIKKLKFGKGYLCTFPEMLGIDSNGIVAPCDGLLDDKKFNIGNILKNDINEILNNKKFLEISNINYNELVGVCSICKYIRDCQGGCRVSSYNNYGNFYCPDSLCQAFYDANIFPDASIDRSKVYKNLKIGN